MIAIRKSYPGPAVLETQGKATAAYLCGLYEAGERVFSFQRALYADGTVKEALKATQFNTCCFCEGIVSDDGDVEHFRPKAGWTQGRGKPLEQPGYYWLAYEWSNLYLACGPCNSRHKRNLFPLEDESRRWRSHLDANAESPLFVDPGKDDPEAHIRWRSEIPVWITSRGDETIGALRLDRPGLNDQRKYRLNETRQLLLTSRLARAKGQAELANRLDALLSAWEEPSAPFSAAVKALLLANGFPPTPI